MNSLLVNAHKEKENLREVETQLLLRLDRKEAENYQLKRVIQKCQDDLGSKTEGLQKAQKIVQRFSEKSQQDDVLI